MHLVGFITKKADSPYSFRKTYNCSFDSHKHLNDFQMLVGAAFCEQLQNYWHEKYEGMGKRDERTA